MAISFGTNISALQTQRKLAESSSTLNSVFQRLSSGLRISRAGDDAAGLSVASALNSHVRVYSQGIRNLNDGLSALNIADGALEQLSSIVTRLSELASQAANGTFGVQQKKALNAEAQALSDEYYRIAKSTSFNNRQLFESDFGKLRLQGGFGVDGGIEYGFGGAIGLGTFQQSASYTTATGNKDVILTDLNGDGNVDLIGNSVTQPYIQVRLGNGDGSFGPTSTYAISGINGSIVHSDFNGDGIVDIIASGYSNDTVAILLGTGNGTFQAAITQDFLGSYNMVSEDFNGDGILDLAGTSGNNSFYHVALGNGDGSFGNMTVQGSTAKSDHLAAGDINGDGIVDLVVTGYTGDSVSIQIGDGSGEFTEVNQYNTGDGPTGVTLTDLNNDNILDIVNTDALDGTIGVFLGNGDGSFRARTAFTTGGSPVEITAGDLDGDGALDLVVAGANGGGIGILIGNGNGTFLAQTTMSPLVTAVDIALGDMNNDGVYDIALAMGATLGFGTYSANTTEGVNPLLPFDLTYTYRAKEALSLFEQKLGQLAQQRGQIGAFQARLSVAMQNIEATRENYLGASSRITDADLAEEAAKLVRTQILQKAAAAILAQANQQPAIGLSLLS